MLDPVTAAKLAELRDMALSKGMVQHAAVLSNLLGPAAKAVPSYDSGIRMRRVAHEIVEALAALNIQPSPKAQECLVRALELLKAP